MPTYLVRFSYDGKNYHGVIPQEGVKTVLGTLLSYLNIKYSRLRVLSRTDKGVSAKENYFQIQTNHKVKNWDVNLEDIKILKVVELKRWIKFKNYVIGKKYIYEIPLNKTLENTFDPFYLIIGENKIKIKQEITDYILNQNYINKAIKYLVGKKYFHNFVRGTIPPEKAICNIYSLEYKKDIENKKVIFEVYGNRFLYEMVRKIVSYLLTVGYGKFPINYVDMVCNKDVFLDPKPKSAEPIYLCLDKIYFKWDLLEQEILDIIY